MREKGSHMERQPSGVKDRERTLAPSWWRWGAFAVALVALSLCLSACGGGSTSGVASVGSSSTTTTVAPAAGAAGNSATDYTDAVSYAACMRSHGITNFPDPTSSGAFVTDRGELNGQDVDQGSSQYSAAHKACSHLLPNGGQITPAEQQTEVAGLLKYVQCMRTHGEPNMPDPTTSAVGGVGVSVPAGLDPSSPQFQAAEKACRSVLPGLGS